MPEQPGIVPTPLEFTTDVIGGDAREIHRDIRPTSSGQQNQPAPANIQRGLVDF